MLKTKVNETKAGLVVYYTSPSAQETDLT